MKKITGLLIAIVSITILLVACKEGSKEVYTLKMRLAKGDVFNNTLDVDMDMSIKMAGMEQKMKMKMNTGSRFEVLDSTAAAQKLKMTYTSMKMTADMGAASDMVNTDSILNATISKAVGKSLILTMENKKITNVSGMDSIRFNEGDPAANAMLDKMFTAENMNQTFGMLFNMYPDKPVKPGDSWERENEMEMGGSLNMKVKTTYTLVAVKDGLAELDVNGKIDSKGSMNQGGMNVGIDMKGTQKGKVYLNQETGYINNGNYDMDINATMDAMGQKIPMTIKSKYTMTGDK